jgi:hypothetical protein
MKLNKIFIALGLFLMYSSGYSQVAISDNATSDPDPASILDLQSTSKGFLTPRMIDTQISAINNPPTGLIVFQTNETAGFYYNSGTPAAPNWERIADDGAGGSGGLWSQTGSDIYYNTGKVGIGTTSPGTTLDVAGSAWFNDSIAIDGSPGRLFINGATGYEPTIRFAENNSTMFKLRYRLADGAFGDPYLMLSSIESNNIWGVTSYGRVRQDYKGSFQAYLLYSSAPRSAMYIDNDDDFIDARCISAKLSNVLADEESVSIASWNSGEGSAILGQNSNYLNYGYVGTKDYGVYGESSSNYWGALGTATSAVFGTLGETGSSQTLTPGDFAIKGIGVRGESQSGTAYIPYSTVGGLMGYNPIASEYSFGVTGYIGSISNTIGRCGGVLGSFNDASEWGALAYRSNNNTEYAGYFTSDPGTGNGKSMLGMSSNIGIGVWGDLFGADIRGNIYGLYTEGQDYSIYANGDVYRTGADIHVQENASGGNSIMYTIVSTEMVIQTYGIGQLQNGKSNIDRNSKQLAPTSRNINVSQKQ